MSQVTIEQEVERLRKYLNPAIKGDVVNAVLSAIATGTTGLINNIRATNDQVYIATASDRYLDEILSKYGISRPPSIGLSDDIFREIGIQVKNRKQVRDLINNLLASIFGDEFVRASNPSRAYEPYSLQDGDELIINFDDSKTATIRFQSSQFQNIAAAKAQEVSDAITKELRRLGLNGTAITKNDGNGPYVNLISDTIGPSSSVTVLGGRAQNELKFDSFVPAGGNMSTQWTLSLQPGGVVRFTWSGGANPQLGKLSIGNYVNIYGGGFASSSNEGSYTITGFSGGAVNTAYFEVVNPLGTSGIIVQGTDSAILFFNPSKKTLASRLSYAALYQSSANLLQIFLPAATKVIRRGREGAAHIHDDPYVSYTFYDQPTSGDNFVISDTVSVQAGTSFIIGSTIQETVENMAEAINLNSGLVAFANDNILNVFQTDLALTLIGTYSGTDNIVPSGPLGDTTSLQSDQQGPYSYDISQPFTVSSTGTLLNQSLDGTMPKLIQVDDASDFPDQQGFIVLGYGTDRQEGPIPYIARPSTNSLLISPSYNVKNSHPEGTDVSYVSSKASVDVARDGSDFPFYLTDVVSGRVYVQELIRSISASGINIVFTILYPSDEGLGKWSTEYTENPEIWS